MKTFSVTKFNSEVKSFLKGYMPADKYFTSFEEIELVENQLSLKGLSKEEIDAVRNTVVMFYDNLMDAEFELNGRTEKYYDFVIAMQSVTGVIDNYIYTKF
jgi:hypothetical protein